MEQTFDPAQNEEKQPSPQKEKKAKKAKQPVEDEPDSEEEELAREKAKREAAYKRRLTLADKQHAKETLERIKRPFYLMERVMDEMQTPVKKPVFGPEPPPLTPNTKARER